MARHGVIDDVLWVFSLASKARGFKALNHSSGLTIVQEGTKNRSTRSPQREAQETETEARQGARYSSPAARRANPGNHSGRAILAPLATAPAQSRAVAVQRSFLLR